MGTQSLEHPVAGVRTTLRSHLTQWAQTDPQKRAVAAAVEKLAEAAAEVSHLLARGPLAGATGAKTGRANADGDAQTTLDVQANTLFWRAMGDAPIAYYASEEEDSILTLDAAAPLAVAIDPLDGSSNIDVDVSVGSIFALFPASPEGATASLFRRGSEQLAAGYVIYGPHTALVLTVGAGVDLFVLDPDAHDFKLVRSQITVAPDTSEFAINASNYRYWHPPVQAFVDDCLEGIEGPRQKNFNMRWIASLVAETHRIFARGGVFLYPADTRPAYAKGRLRLLYEAAPIAFLAEQAGCGATDGIGRILDKVPGELHERTPLVFGSRNKIERIAKYHVDPSFVRDAPPLFGERGLFRS